MYDLIDRQAAIDEIKSVYEWHDTVTMERLIEHLNNLPSVEAEPVRHGHWIIKDNPGTGWYRVTCSECGEDVTSAAPVIGFFPNARVIWDFCPECGADMRGD